MYRLCAYRQHARSRARCYQHPARPNPRQEISSCPRLSRLISAFHNLSAGDLADQLGSIKVEIAALEEREKSLRDELIRRGVAECQGAAFGASVTQGIRWTLNTQLVKSEMGLPWYDAHCLQSSVTTVSVKPIAAVAAQRLAA